ncbi:MAG: LptF/LptG family permease [Acidobacteria bacterium]|nr:LptF/LptG family permease [Acidobacteriota bacterium]
MAVPSITGSLAQREQAQYRNVIYGRPVDYGLSTPLLIPLMALLAVPFAFRIGKKGTLAGIGVGLALGMAFLIAGAFFTKVGEVGALPPILAAWSPNVLAATAATWLLLRLRT